MALSESTINFNYNMAIGKAAELEAAAGQLESEAVSEIGNIISSIKRDWEGRCSDEYTAKCVKEQNNLQELASDMRNTASTMRTMAQNVKDAEMRALAIARAAAEAARAAAEAAAAAAKI